MSLGASWPIVSVEEMRRLEAVAAEAGISETQLQLNAAEQLAEVALDLLGPPGPRLTVVLAGPGNNGRDAVLAGARLLERGYLVHFYLSPRHSVQEAELERLRSLGASILVHGNHTLDTLHRWLARARVAVDGLLGTGVKGPMRAELAEMASACNRARAEAQDGLCVVAVDVPSGVDADSGQVPGEAVSADVTVALGAIKVGTLRYPAAELTGRLEARAIGLPPNATEPLPTWLMDQSMVARLFPLRPKWGHKGTFGRTLVVGGSREYVGAPILAAMAAGRVGSGLVQLAVPVRVQSAAAALLPEATYALLPGDGAESDPKASLGVVRASCAHAQAVVLGPGLGRSEGAATLVRGLLQQHDERQAWVVDADALYHLVSWPDWQTTHPARLVLTPHLGEMARLCGQSLNEIRRDTWGVARHWAQSWGCTVVLKDSLSVVAEPSGCCWVSPWANPALATGGSGDVLAGALGGLLAQGLGCLEASVLAVALQAEAARAIGRSGRPTLLASELAASLPQAMASLSPKSQI